MSDFDPNNACPCCMEQIRIHNEKHNLLYWLCLEQGYPLGAPKVSRSHTRRRQNPKPEASVGKRFDSVSEMNRAMFPKHKAKSINKYIKRSK